LHGGVSGADRVLKLDEHAPPRRFRGGVQVAEATIEELGGSIAPCPSAPGDWALRVLDVVVATAALLFVLPLLAGIALALRLFDDGPILYAHARVGRDGKEFACLKFRTMAVDSEARLQALLAANPSARREWELYQKLAADPRITRIGRFLRSSSLDELPQLLNVITGEMSLVGPRPIVRGEASRYGRYFHTYCSVRPGITGLWQVLGRNRVSYRRRVAMDVLYIRRRSLALNLRVLLATVPAVLMRRGAA
jgi:lipopolysaccharide/colanic/teichoic acid biosynthesis glycosyltransferase